VTFSPLFIGAWGETSRPERRSRNDSGLSVPYSSGRGVRRARNRSPKFGVVAFSPLFIGAWGETEWLQALSAKGFTFQSPIHRGVG